MEKNLSYLEGEKSPNLALGKEKQDLLACRVDGTGTLGSGCAGSVVPPPTFFSYEKMHPRSTFNIFSWFQNTFYLIHENFHPEEAFFEMITEIHEYNILLYLLMIKLAFRLGQESSV